MFPSTHRNLVEKGNEKARRLFEAKKHKDSTGLSCRSHAAGLNRWLKRGHPHVRTVGIRWGISSASDIAIVWIA